MASGGEAGGSGAAAGVVDAFVGGAQPRGKRQLRLSTGVDRLRGRRVDARSGGADGASSIAASSAGGRRHSGVNAIRQAAPHMARKRRGWRIVMGPILFDEDGPTLLTKI